MKLEAHLKTPILCCLVFVRYVATHVVVFFSFPLLCLYTSTSTSLFLLLMKITDWCICYVLNFKTCMFWKPALVNLYSLNRYQDMTSRQQTCTRSVSLSCCCKALFRFSFCSFTWPSSSTSWLLSLSLCSFCSCRNKHHKHQSLFNSFLCCSLWSLLLRRRDLQAGGTLLFLLQNSF